MFRGRIHQFASSVFSVADKSAINMRGDYSEVKTVWEKESEVEQIKVEEEKKKEGKMGEKAEEGGKKDGDVEMEDAEKKDEPAEQQADRPTERSTYQAADQSMEQPPTEDEAPSTPSTLKDPDFYSTLWSLQQYFSHPPSLDGPAVGSPPKTPFQTFRDKSDFILFQLFEQTKKEKAMTGTEDGMGKKRKRDVMEGGQDTGGFFHPRFLTGKRLFEYELADSSFRRQILVQYFILFQFLLNLTPAHAGKQAFTGGMPRTFMLEQTDEQWVKSKIGGIKDELKRIVGGVSFEDTVFSIIRQEAHYVRLRFIFIYFLKKTQLISDNRYNGRMKDVQKRLSRSPHLTPTLPLSQRKHGQSALTRLRRTTSRSAHAHYLCCGIMGSPTLIS